MGEVFVEFETRNEPTLNLEAMVDHALDQKHTGGTSYV